MAVGPARAGDRQTGAMTGPRDDGQSWDATPPGQGWTPGGAPAGRPGPPAGNAAPGGYAPPPSYGAAPPPPGPWGAAPPPGYGAGYWAPVPVAAPWPKGPGRPSQASSAAVLGFVAGGAAILWGLVGIVLLAGSDGGSSTWLGVVVGLPAGAALIYGAIRLLARTDRWFLVGGAAALAVTVLLQAVVSAASSYGTASGQATLVVFLLPVPTVAAVLAALPLVGGWIAAGRGTGQQAPPPQGVQGW